MPLKKTLSKTRYEKDEADIQNVMHTIELLQNLFTYYEKELIKIASGQVAPSEIKDILTEYEKGYSVSNQFVLQWLIWKQVEFSASLETMKLKTFSYFQTKHPHQKSMKETNSLKADKDLTKFLIVAKTQKVDLGENLMHCLSQFLFSLSNSEGSLHHTNKATLFYYL